MAAVRTSIALARRLGGAVLLLAAIPAFATDEYFECVGSVYGTPGDINDVGLLPALYNASAGAEGTIWHIQVRARGSQNPYVISNDLKFAPDDSHDNKTLYISGGWDSTCSGQTEKSSLTVIKGVASTGQSIGTSLLFSGDNARFDISWIHFQDFARFSVDDSACQNIFGCPDTEAIDIEHNEFDNGEQVSIHAHDAARVVFRGNRVTHINNRHAVGILTTGGAPASFLIDNNEDAPQITFNTFGDLTCNTSLAGLMINSHQPDLAFHHNVVAANCAAVYFDTSDGGQAPTPYYNVANGYLGNYSGDLFDNNNINGTVNFVDAANGDYHLQDTSAGVNDGASLVEAIQSGFLLPGTDLDGNVRPTGVHFDMGAYESSKKDGTPPVFTVTKTADTDGTCGANCSLREAIKAAVAWNGTNPPEIAFDIPGPCPQIIYLQSNLPDITSPVTIDGYTQPGANANSWALGSNANICIAVSPATTGVDYALRVPAGAPASTILTVQGLAFANGFYAFSASHAAIELRGGFLHKIYGNVFGGYLPSTTNIQYLGTLGRALLVLGPAGGVRIGDDDPSTRNYFGYMSQNGIVLNNGTSADYIANNYIGVQPNGLIAQPNDGDCISISSAVGTIIRKNVIDASEAGISLLGANTKNTVATLNRIGVNAALKGGPANSNSVGISIGLGSSNNTIGFGDTANANVISNNLGDGIQIGSTPGSSPDGPIVSKTNVIRGNRIENNGRSGQGIAIDLGGSQTQLANDAGDADDGANTLQNYPAITTSAITFIDYQNNYQKRTTFATINALPNVALVVDYYFSTACGNAGMLVASETINSTGASGIVESGSDYTDLGPGFLTATATNYLAGTSELSPCWPTDRIFQGRNEQDGF